MPDFEIYRRGSRPDGPPMVTITAAGAISFSVAAFEALGSPAAIVYLIDRDERLIGFRAAAVGETSAYHVNAGRGVSARSILNAMGISYGTGRRYPLLTGDGTPHIDLKQPGTPVTSNRRKKTSKTEDS